jgi:hypothetical protein
MIKRVCDEYILLSALDLCPPQLMLKPTEDVQQKTGRSSSNFARGRITSQIVMLYPSFPVPGDCFDTLNCVWGPIYPSFIQSARYPQAMVHFPPWSHRFQTADTVYYTLRSTQKTQVQMCPETIHHGTFN